MPAINMPNPADAAGAIPSNPTAGQFVVFDPVSGPKGSPLDARSYDPTSQLLVADPTNYSTGASNTGIGINANPIYDTDAGLGVEAQINPGMLTPGGTAIGDVAPVAPQAITGAAAYEPYNVWGAALLYIGGGYSAKNIAGIAADVRRKVTALVGFGNGGARDGVTAGSGHGVYAATATADAIDNGEIIASSLSPVFDVVNRSGNTMNTGDEAYGQRSDDNVIPIAL